MRVFIEPGVLLSVITSLVANSPMGYSCHAHLTAAETETQRLLGNLYKLSFEPRQSDTAAQTPAFSSHNFDCPGGGLLGEGQLLLP